MILNDLEALVRCPSFLGISRDFAELGGNNGYTNEGSPVLSAA